MCVCVCVCVCVCIYIHVEFEVMLVLAICYNGPAFANICIGLMHIYVEGKQKQPWVVKKGLFK